MPKTKQSKDDKANLFRQDPDQDSSESSHDEGRSDSESFEERKRAREAQQSKEDKANLFRQDPDQDKSKSSNDGGRSDSESFEIRKRAKEAQQPKEDKAESLREDPDQDKSESSNDGGRSDSESYEERKRAKDQAEKEESIQEGKSDTEESSDQESVGDNSPDDNDETKVTEANEIKSPAMESETPEVESNEGKSDSTESSSENEGKSDSESEADSETETEEEEEEQTDKYEKELGSTSEEMEEEEIVLDDEAIKKIQTDLLALSQSPNEDINQFKELFSKTPIDDETKGKALFKAAAYGHVNIVQFLLDKNADINYQFKGNTPLIAAISQKRNEVAKLLIEKGADINKTNDATPLMHAINTKNNEISQLLIQSDQLNVHAVDKRGWTAFMFAQEMSMHQVADSLKNKGAKAQEKLPFHDSLQKTGFEIQDVFKHHITGTVAKAKYHSHKRVNNIFQDNGDAMQDANDKIERIQGKESVILKMPAIQDEKSEYGRLLKNEFNNSLYLSTKENDKKISHRPSLLLINVGDAEVKKPVIVIECIYSDKDKTKTKDVEQFLSELGKEHAGQNVINNPPDFDVIFNSIYSTLGQLHEEGLLHLDTACRNYIIDMDTHLVRIIDFGLSLRTDENGNAIETEETRFKRLPTFYDAQGRNKYDEVMGPDGNKQVFKEWGKRTIHTDFHAFKLTMIEAMFYYINKDMKFSKSDDDQATVKTALDCLKTEVAALPDSDGRKAIVEKAIAKYEPYLNYASANDPSNKAATLETIRNNDKQHFPTMDLTATLKRNNALNNKPTIEKPTITDNKVVKTTPVEVKPVDSPRDKPKNPYKKSTTAEMMRAINKTGSRLNLSIQKDKIIDILKKHREIYKKKKGLTAKTDNHDKLIEAVKAANTDFEAAKIVQNEYNQIYESFAKNNKNADQDAFIRTMNKSDSSNHYGRSIGNSLQEIYSTCKIPNVAPQGNIMRLKSYDDFKKIKTKDKDKEERPELTRKTTITIKH